MTRIFGYITQAVTSLILLLGLSNCQNDDLKSPPRYILEIPRVNFTSNYATQGTADQRINTVWVSVNDRPIGTYQLPAKIFFTTEPGPNDIRVVAGVSQNGVNALRTEFPFFETYRETILVEADRETYFLREDVDSLPLFRYVPGATIINVEDFEGTGFRVQTTSRSQVPIIRTMPTDNHFNSSIPGEPNQFSGIARLNKGEVFFEIESVQAFNIPRGGGPVYAELHYNINHPMTIGLIARTPGGGSEQFSVVEVRPTNETWRKIYVSFTDDISGTFGAIDYRIFLGGIRQDTTDETELKFMIDNLKLLY